MSDKQIEAAARTETACQDSKLIDQPSFYAGYLAGAYAERDKLAQLVEALERIAHVKCAWQLSQEIAQAALREYRA